MPVLMTQVDEDRNEIDPSLRRWFGEKFVMGALEHGWYPIPPWNGIVRRIVKETIKNEALQ